MDFPAPQLDFASTASWWDPDTECWLTVATPQDERELWNDYLDGAVRSYRKHGVECALPVDQIRRGDDTALFFAMVDASGRVAGGLRAKGPLRTADDSHAVVEWAGQPGEQAVRKVITHRLPFGVAEMKSAWVTDDRDRSPAMTNTLARTALHTIAALDIRFAMATSAAHVLEKWQSSGGVVVSRIPATPYPSARYRTKIMFWDRSTFAQHAQPRQVAKALDEMAYLADRADAVPLAALGSGL